MSVFEYESNMLFLANLFLKMYINKVQKLTES